MALLWVIAKTELPKTKAFSNCICLHPIRGLKHCSIFPYNLKFPRGLSRNSKFRINCLVCRKPALVSIGLYRDVWIAAIASSTTSLATRTAAICVRFQGRRVRRAYVTMQITFLTRKSALIYSRQPHYQLQWRFRDKSLWVGFKQIEPCDVLRNMFDQRR